MKTNISPAIAACIVSLDKTSETIQLLPSGTFTAPNGSLKGQGPWHLDQDSAAKLIAAVAQRQNDILIDYEHQSLLAAQNGKPAPAAAWLKTNSLFWTENGLFAKNPQWTEAALKMIAADEYRYLSPVFTYDAQTGTPLNLLSVALTNTPAIDNMAAVSLAAASLSFTENPMEIEDLMERLRYLLNLPLTTTPAEMSSQLDKLKTMLTPATGQAAMSLFDLLALKDNQIAALSAQKPNPAEFVPVAVMTELQAKVAALTAQINTDKVTGLVSEALQSGKLLPPQQEWAITLGKKDLAALTAYLEVAQPIAALQGNQSGGHRTEPLAATTMEQQWQTSGSLQAEFITASDYVAFKQAEQSGKIKTSGA